MISPLKIYFLFFALIFSGLAIGNPNSSITILDNANVSKSEKQQLTEAINFWKHTLGLGENIYFLIIINPSLPENVHGYTLFNEKISDYQGRQVTIGVNSTINFQKKLLTLAHEMVHAKQFLSGELVKQEQHDYVWKGKVWEDINDVCYIHRPWEREALSQAIKLVKLRRKHPDAEHETQKLLISID